MVSWVDTFICLEYKIKRKIVNIFLSISLNICFGCSKEQSHRRGPLKYSQHVLFEK